MNIGKVIKKARKAQSLTQQELVQGAGISRQYLSNLESGKRRISVDVLEKLANELNINVTYSSGKWQYEEE